MIFSTNERTPQSLGTRILHSSIPHSPVVFACDVSILHRTVTSYVQSLGGKSDWRERVGRPTGLRRAFLMTPACRYNWRTHDTSTSTEWIRMPTAKQTLGVFGEQLVVRACECPRCKRKKTLKRLPPNFKCADVICDFCGFLGQVKTSTAREVTIFPRLLLGAAWGPQKARMNAAIYFPLFLVLVTSDLKDHAIYYLSADLQPPELFRPRSPLSETAKRAGWRGFLYDLSVVKDRIVCLDLKKAVSKKGAIHRAI